MPNISISDPIECQQIRPFLFYQELRFKDQLHLFSDIHIALTWTLWVVVKLSDKLTNDTFSAAYINAKAVYTICSAGFDFL